MAFDQRLLEHLRTGATSLCRCWRIGRLDGRVHGFTDHDEPLSFGGTDFLPNDGLTSKAVEQSTGLSVDNSEALGVLSSAGVTEEAIAAGRFDGAAVAAWLVNWSDPSERQIIFRGEIGEIQRSAGSFKAELRGLTEALHQPQGRTYQASCPAILGDADCRVDLGDPRYSLETEIRGTRDGRYVDLETLAEFGDRWFERGRLHVLSGASAGDVRSIKNDRKSGGVRTLELWESLRGGIEVGDRVRVEAGCDKRFTTCQAKFANAVNFRGFPHLPGEDFLMAYPKKGQSKPAGAAAAVRTS